MANDLLEGPPSSEAMFCKYVTRQTGEIVLRSRRLRWSSPFAFNDPFDNQFELGIVADPALVRKLALSKIWEDYIGASGAGGKPGFGLRLRLGSVRPTPEQVEESFGPEIDAWIASGLAHLPRMHQDIGLLARQHKILCMTTIPDSILMWSYYAESHQGLVLGFRMVDGQDSPWRMGRPVSYSKVMPGLLGPHDFSDLLSGRASVDVQGVLEKIVFTKAFDWSHEKEWRIFSGVGRDPGALFEDVPFHAMELSSVLFGCKMPSEDRSKFVRLISELYPHVEILQAIPSKSEYALSIVPV